MPPVADTKEVVYLPRQDRSMDRSEEVIFLDRLSPMKKKQIEQGDKFTDPSKKIKKPLIEINVIKTSQDSKTYS